MDDQYPCSDHNASAETFPRQFVESPHWSDHILNYSSGYTAAPRFLKQAADSLRVANVRALSFEQTGTSTLNNDPSGYSSPDATSQFNHYICDDTAFNNVILSMKDISANPIWSSSNATLFYNTSTLYEPKAYQQGTERLANDSKFMLVGMPLPRGQWSGGATESPYQGTFAHPDHAPSTWDPVPEILHQTSQDTQSPQHSHGDSPEPILGVTENTVVEGDVDTVIGTIRLSGDINCHQLGCTRMYGRFAELKRHYETTHAIEKPEFWCSIPLCERSMAGGRPFRRKDKLRDHVRKVHKRGDPSLVSSRRKKLGGQL